MMVEIINRLKTELQDCSVRLTDIKLFNTLQAHGVFPLIMQVRLKLQLKSELLNVFPLINEWCRAVFLELSDVAYQQISFQCDRDRLANPAVGGGVTNHEDMISYII